MCLRCSSGRKTQGQPSAGILIFLPVTAAALLKNCQSQENRQFYDPRFDLLADVTEKTTAINIAFARYTKSTYQYASLVKKRGAKLISFTDTPSSPFCGISDYVMQVAALKDDMGFSSLVCLYCLFDVLTAKIREERHVEISKRLKTCEIIYSDFDLFYE